MFKLQTGICHNSWAEWSLHWETNHSTAVFLRLVPAWYTGDLVGCLFCAERNAWARGVGCWGISRTTPLVSHSQQVLVRFACVVPLNTNRCYFGEQACLLLNPTSSVAFFWLSCFLHAGCSHTVRTILKYKGLSCMQTNLLESKTLSCLTMTVLLLASKTKTLDF